MIIIIIFSILQHLVSLMLYQSYKFHTNRSSSPELKKNNKKKQKINKRDTQIKDFLEKQEVVTLKTENTKIFNLKKRNWPKKLKHVTLSILR